MHVAQPKKKVEDDTHRWKDILCSQIGRINVKITILFKAIYRLNAIRIKIPMAFFYRTKTNNFKMCIETQKTISSQTIMKKKNITRGILLTGLRLCYKAIVVKTVCNVSLSLSHTHTHKPHRLMEQDSPEINPCTYGQLIYDRRDKNIQWRKKSLF